MKVRVHVMLKPGVLDVQGKAIASALHSLGHEGVSDLRAGKYFTFTLAARDRASAEREVDEMSRGLLANTVIEEYSFELLDDAAPAREAR